MKAVVRRDWSNAVVSTHFVKAVVSRDCLKALVRRDWSKALLSQDFPKAVVCRNRSMAALTMPSGSQQSKRTGIDSGNATALILAVLHSSP